MNIDKDKFANKVTGAYFQSLGGKAAEMNMNGKLTMNQEVIDIFVKFYDDVERALDKMLP
jgi:hypothetical protein